MSTPALPNPPAGAPKKKKGPLFWILIGVGTLVVLGCLVVGVGIFFVSRLASNAGVDLNDLKNNPAIAAARLVAAANPNYEILRDNEDGQSITVRDKSTGEELTMRMNPDTRQIEVLDRAGNAKIQFDGQNGRVNVEGPDGKASYGIDTDAALPSWIPAYPGTAPKSAFSGESTEGKTGTFTFQTADSTQKVFDFYEGRLKDGGFTIATRATQPTGGTMIASDAGEQRQVVFIMDADGQVTIQATEKN